MSLLIACSLFTQAEASKNTPTVAADSYEVNRLRPGSPLIIFDVAGLAHPSVFQATTSDSLLAQPLSFANADIQSVRLLPWHKAIPHPRAEKGGPEWLFIDERWDLWLGPWTATTIGGGAAAGSLLGSIAAGTLLGGFGGFVVFLLLFH